MQLSFPFRHRVRFGLVPSRTTTLSAALVVTLLLATPSPSQTDDHSLTAIITEIPAFSPDLPTAGTSFTNDVDSNGPPFVCSVYASNPAVDNAHLTVKGEGSQFCQGIDWQPQHIRVTIQWYLGFGFWSNRNRVSTENTDDGSVHRTISYICTGTGTHTYRIVTDGYAAHGAYSQSVQSEHYVQITCRSHFD